MTRTELERLAVLEEQVTRTRDDIAEVKADLGALAELVRAAIECKADKSEVAELRKSFIGVALASAGFAITALVGIVLTALKLK